MGFESKLLIIFFKNPINYTYIHICFVYGDIIGYYIICN